MGRAMLIMCSGILVAMGYINMSVSKQGKLLMEKTVNYADYIMAKNTAHTAIQIAMQKINKDDTWAETHNKDNPWTTTLNNRQVELYTVYDESPDFWEPDDLRMVSNASYYDNSVQVISQYLKEPFSALVPDFQSALQLPTDIGEFNVDGTAHEINGTPPPESGCTDSKPPVTVHSKETKEKLEEENLKKKEGSFEGDDIVVDNSLSYEPTDELIERLYNSGNATMVDGDFSDQLGTSDKPGVFFIDGEVKLTGNQSEGFGILVVRSHGNMEYEDTELSVAGNFEFNGLVIFENAYNFDGRGTPTINGSVLIGNTEDYEGDPIDIDLGGNININYDCLGENYAKQAAALAVEQFKYTRVVTMEGTNYSQ